MNFLDTFVILDTCVLLKQRVSDVLMDLRSEKVFSAHWTENIDEEFLRNMQEVYDLSETRAMKARCPEWEVFILKLITRKLFFLQGKLTFFHVNAKLP